MGNTFAGTTAEDGEVAVDQVDPQSIPRCYLCFAPADKRCHQCKVVKYCSRNCQRADWKDHKGFCKNEEAVAKIMKARLQYFLDRRPQYEQLSSGQLETTMERTEAFSAALSGKYEVYAQLKPSEEFVLVKAPYDDYEGKQIEIRWVNADSAMKFGVGEPFIFLNGPSLALELAATDAEYKLLQGGPLYMQGEPHLFWSMILHREQTGLCIPPPKKDLQWDEAAWCFEEMARLSSQVDEQASPGGHVTLGSRSMAATAALTLMSESRDPTSLAMTTFPFSLLVNAENPAVPCKIPTNKDDLPPWWKELERMWSGVLDRAKERGSAPCMFYSTPLGCMTLKLGGDCPCFHDDEWSKDIDEYGATAIPNKPSSTRPGESGRCTFLVE